MSPVLDWIDQIPGEILLLVFVAGACWLMLLRQRRECDGDWETRWRLVAVKRRWVPEWLWRGLKWSVVTPGLKVPMGLLLTKAVEKEEDS